MKTATLTLDRIIRNAKRTGHLPGSTVVILGDFAQDAETFTKNGYNAIPYTQEAAKTADVFYASPELPANESINVFEMLAKQDARLLLIGDEIEWEHCIPKQLNHDGTRTAGRRYTVYRKP